MTDENQYLMFNSDFKYYIINENFKESCDYHILRNKITNIWNAINLEIIKPLK